MQHLRCWVDALFPGSLEDVSATEECRSYERRRRKRDRAPEVNKDSDAFPLPLVDLFDPSITTTAPTPPSRQGTSPRSMALFDCVKTLDDTLPLVVESESAAIADGHALDNEEEGSDEDESSGSASDGTDHMDPRILRRIEHFRRIPRLVPDMEFFFRYALCVMLHCLLTALCTPVKVLLQPSSISRRDVMTIYFIGVGIATFYAVGYPESRVLYSTLYHAVRTAATIKLYLLFSILEVSDRLLTSVTSDSLEIFYAVVGGLVRRKQAKHNNRKRAHINLPDTAEPTASLGIAVASFFVSTVTVALHAMVLLLHVVALNVAINSEGNSILALVISNNFFEIRTVVFKKFVRESLFQVYCADALERIQLVVFLLCVILQHFNTDGSGTLEVTDVLTVVACELLVDFLKHYFVATFNGVSLSLYRSYHQVLMFDVAADHFLWRLGASVPLTCEDSTVDDKALRRLVSPSTTFVPSASRRFGFVPMPYLAVLLWCVFPILLDMWQRGRVVAMLLLIGVVLGLKSLIQAYLVGNASRFTIRSLLVPLPTPTARERHHSSQQSHQAQDVDRLASTVRLEHRNEDTNSCSDGKRRWSLFSRGTKEPKRAPQADLLLSPPKGEPLFGVSPQLTPMRFPKHPPPSTRDLMRSKSMPLLTSTGSFSDTANGCGTVGHRSAVHISKVLLSLIMTERFDVNAGKAAPKQL